MDVAPGYTLFTLFTLFILFKLLYTAQTAAFMPIYIVREGLEVKWSGCMDWME